MGRNWNSEKKKIGGISITWTTNKKSEVTYFGRKLRPLTIKYYRLVLFKHSRITNLNSCLECYVLQAKT